MSPQATHGADWAEICCGHSVVAGVLQAKKFDFFFKIFLNSRATPDHQLV